MSYEFKSINCKLKKNFLVYYSYFAAVLLSPTYRL